MGGRQAEYDIQGPLETALSQVESKVEVQGVTSHAGSAALSVVDSVVDALGTPAGSAAASQLESKLTAQGVSSHAGSAGLSVVDSVVDALGTPAGSAAASQIESKLVVQGVAAHATSAALQTVDNEISAIESKVENIPTTDLSVATSQVESKLATQGVAAHATSAALQTVDNEVSQLESKLDAGVEVGIKKTIFQEATGAETPLAAADWATLWEDGTLDSDTRVKAVKISIIGDPVGFGYRFYDGGEKLFPYGESKAFEDDIEYVLAEVVSQKVGQSLLLQVFASSTGGASMQLTNLKLIKQE